MAKAVIEAVKRKLPEVRSSVGRQAFSGAVELVRRAN
jgi:hypothetical protein